MRKRYQEGGEVESEEPVGALDPTSAVMMAMTEAFGRTTTPEAQEFARQILKKQMTPDESSRESILSGKRTQAEQVRAALRTARQRLMAQPTMNRSELLLAIGRGLGSPTRTGAFGETVGNVAREASDPIRRQREFELGRDDALSQLDLADAQADEGYIDAEFQLNKLREEIEGRLSVEALDTLGKTLTSSRWRGPVPKAVEALDAAYVKDYYLPFTTGGNERMAAGLNRLRFVKDVLENGSDALTGRYVGAVAGLPGVGRWLQAAVLPTSADLRDLVERTIQEDLRPTLGSQFTQTEGENLIARSYNTSLEEPENARRLGQLIEQMEAVHKNQVGMAEWFGQNQTLMGYQNPKLGYSESDFQFGDEEPRSSDGRFRFEDLPRREQEMFLSVWQENNPGQPMPPEFIEALKPFAKGGRVRYQEGGVVMPQQRPGVQMPDSPVESTLLDDLKLAWEDYNDPIGTTLGGVGGLLTNAALDSLAERVVGGTERRVADAIESGGLDPLAVAQDIKRNRRAGVPETLMDVDTAGVRALAQDAFKFGDAPAENALRELRNRLEGSRERVNERVNAGLKPYEFFDYDNKLVGQIEGPRTQEMKQAFDQYKAIPVDKVLSEILATPEGKRATDWAFRFYENAPGRSPGKIDRAGILQQPNLEFLDYIRKGFNQTIAREEAGGDTEFGQVLRDLKKAYVDRLDQIAPEYQVARETQGDDLRIRDSLHAGRGFMRKQPEELAGIAQGLSFHERNAFRTGMAQHLYEVLDRATGENFNAAQRIVGSPAMLARLEPFFDSAQEFKLFQTALERESELMRIGKQRLNEGESGRMFREKNRQTMTGYVSQRAPGLRFAISLPGWTLRLLRDMPKMTSGEAERVLGVLRRGRPDEMDAFAKRIKNLRRIRKTRWGRRGAAAAIGAGAAAIAGADDEE